MTSQQRAPRRTPQRGIGDVRTSTSTHNTNTSKGIRLPEHIGPAPTYDKRHGAFGWLALLLSLHYGAMSRVFLWALVGMGYTIALHETISCQVWPAYCANGHPQFQASVHKFLIIHPFAYQAIMISSGFGLVFRLSQSLARYWEARTAAQQMSSKWLDGVAMSIAFDEEADPEVSKAKQCPEFARSISHLGSLLHACAMHMLRTDSSLSTLQCRPAAPVKEVTLRRAYTHKSSFASQSEEIPHLKWSGHYTLNCCSRWADTHEWFARRNPIGVLGGVLPGERRALEESAERVHVVIGWIMRLLVRRRKAGGLSHDAPIVSRIYQVFSDGNLAFMHALKVVDTPFPFAYAQLNSLICFVNLALFPLVVADKVWPCVVALMAPSMQQMQIPCQQSDLPTVTTPDTMLNILDTGSFHNCCRSLLVLWHCFPFRFE